MENLEIFEEISALKNLSNEYERQLKLFGIDLCDLPDDSASLLTEYAEIKSSTKLHDLSMTNLEEFIYIKKKEQIEQQVIASKLKNDIVQLERQLEAENSAIQELKEFITSLDERIVSEAEMEKTKILTEKTMEGLKEKQLSLFIPKDLNVDELISKVETLEQRKKSKHS